MLAVFEGGFGQMFPQMEILGTLKQPLIVLSRPPPPPPPQTPPSSTSTSSLTAPRGTTTSCISSSGRSRRRWARAPSPRAASDASAWCVHTGGTCLPLCRKHSGRRKRAVKIKMKNGPEAAHPPSQSRCLANADVPESTCVFNLPVDNASLSL